MEFLNAIFCPFVSLRRKKCKNTNCPKVTSRRPQPLETKNTDEILFQMKGFSFLRFEDKDLMIQLASWFFSGSKSIGKMQNKFPYLDT